MLSAFISELKEYEEEGVVDDLPPVPAEVVSPVESQVPVEAEPSAESKSEPRHDNDLYEKDSETDAAIVPETAISYKKHVQNRIPNLLNLQIQILHLNQVNRHLNQANRHYQNKLLIMMAIKMPKIQKKYKNLSKK